MVTRKEKPESISVLFFKDIISFMAKAHTIFNCNMYKFAFLFCYYSFLSFSSNFFYS